MNGGMFLTSMLNRATRHRSQYCTKLCGRNGSPWSCINTAHAATEAGARGRSGQRYSCRDLTRIRTVKVVPFNSLPAEGQIRLVLLFRRGTIFHLQGVRSASGRALVRPSKSSWSSRGSLASEVVESKKGIDDENATVSWDNRMHIA